MLSWVQSLVCSRVSDDVRNELRKEGIDRLRDIAHTSQADANRLAGKKQDIVMERQGLCRELALRRARGRGVESSATAIEVVRLRSFAVAVASIDQRIAAHLACAARSTESADALEQNNDGILRVLADLNKKKVLTLRTTSDKERLKIEALMRGKAEERLEHDRRAIEDDEEKRMDAIEIETERHASDVAVAMRAQEAAEERRELREQLPSGDLSMGSGLNDADERMIQMYMRDEGVRRMDAMPAAPHHLPSADDGAPAGVPVLTDTAAMERLADDIFA